MLPERIERRIVRDTSGCWLWAGRIGNGDYGRVDAKIGGRWKSQLAHRYVYELLVGSIPEGQVVDHLCRVRHCVNPEHLELVTQRDNILRGDRPKSHCPQGHEYAVHGTISVERTGYIRKSCRPCAAERERRKRAAV